MRSKLGWWPPPPVLFFFCWKEGGGGLDWWPPPSVLLFFIFYKEVGVCLPSPMPMPVPMPRCCTLLRLFWPTPNAHAISVPVPMFMRSWSVATSSWYICDLRKGGKLTIPYVLPALPCSLCLYSCPYLCECAQGWWPFLPALFLLDEFFFFC